MNQEGKIVKSGNFRIIRWIALGLLTMGITLVYSKPSINGLAQANQSYEGQVVSTGTIINKNDYDQVAKFALGITTAKDGSEFQRADSAPRTTLGDGRISVGDMVQAMRYASGLDPLMATGGPSAAIKVESEKARLEMAREVKVGAPTFGPGTVTVPLEIIALGNENGTIFTLSFDPTKLSNPTVVLGTDASAALLLVNADPSLLVNGKVAVGVVLPPGQAFVMGTRQFARVTFNVAQGAYGTTTSIGFSSTPIPLEIADVNGILLDQAIFTGNQNLQLLIPAPTLTSISPNSALEDSPAFTITVTGTNFIPQSKVRWNGVDLATTYVSATTLTALVPAANVAFALTVPASVAVFSPAPGGGTTTSLPFTVNNRIPVVGSLSNGFIAAGTAGTLDVNGSGFVAGAIVYLNGRPCPTRYVSRTRVSFDYLAVDIACAGIYTIRVINPTPGGGTSGGVLLTVSPVISALNPTIAYTSNGSFTLTVTGLGFCEGSKIRWNGTPRTTTFVSATQLTTLVTAAELATAGNISISVITSDLVGSNILPFTISACSPAVPSVSVTSAIDFGDAVIPARELQPTASRPSRTFTISNSGCQTATVNLAVRRTGADVTSGKITNTDDSATFNIYQVTNGVATLLNLATPITINGSSTPNGVNTITFRIVFDPKIPAPAGGITNLAASQIIPDEIVSTLQVTRSTDGAATVLGSSTLTGRVQNNSRFINPLAPRLEPLVVFTKSGANEFTVEASGYDANTDIYYYTYQFFDASGNKVGTAPGFDLDLKKLGILKGQSFSLVKKFSANECGLNASRVQVFFYDSVENAFATSLAIGTGRGRVINATSVSAASYSPSAIAPESIAAAFGEGFGAETDNAKSLPLPTELGGVRIFVTDSNKVERTAPLYFVSPYQLNYQIPVGTTDGEAKVVVAYNGEVISTGTMTVSAMAPALFTANSDGQGVPAAYVTRVMADNSQITEAVAQYDAAQKKFMPAPINLGSPEEQVFLTLFGSGIRNRYALSSVSAKIAGVDAEVLYAGPQGFYVGVDQVNVRVPRAALVNGEVDLVVSVDGKKANTVRVHVR